MNDRGVSVAIWVVCSLYILGTLSRITLEIFQSRGRGHVVN